MSAGTPEEPPPLRIPAVQDGALTAASVPSTVAAIPPSFALQAEFLDANPQQRPNIGSMLFLTAFFLFMSSNNNQPQIVIVGPDGQIQPRMTELDRARTQVEEYRGVLNGTSDEKPGPQVLPASILPSVFQHSAVARGHFFPNITGFHRHGIAHAVNLLQPPQTWPLDDEVFFDHVHIPYLNSSRWNETLAQELRGGWNWALIEEWEMNVKERAILPAHSEEQITTGVDDEEWSWTRGILNLHGRTGSDKALSRATSLDYDFVGLHHIPNGTYELYAVPQGSYLDLRNIPRLLPRHSNTTRKIVMRELQREKDTQEASLLLTDLQPEDAALASASLLLVLFLLVRQMEITRTPSTLAHISLWSIVLTIFADSFIFSAHVAVGTVSNNKTSLPLLVPGFLSLCTAIVFGPRYAVLLYRVQAPERIAEPPPIVTAIATPVSTLELAEAGGEEGRVAGEELSYWARCRSLFTSYPKLKYTLVGLLFLFAFQLILIPSVSPILLIALFSFWVPQIWRNAQRRSIGVDRVFILGTSIGRLAIPLYALGCPDNIFFFEGSSWIWVLIAWQATQVSVLLAQEKLGPAFFLPRRFAPTAGYDYHPPFPTPSEFDKDVPTTPHVLMDERTCSICMEEVNTHPSAITSMEAAETPLKGMRDWGSGQQRRTYALAPCGHLFHTACLSQWLAVKTICPLCKRSLPPL